MKKKQMYLHRSADGTEPKIQRGYDAKFRASAGYRSTLPDMMEAAHDAIQGANVLADSTLVFPNEHETLLPITE